jgi:hypothetical protein
MGGAGGEHVTPLSFVVLILSFGDTVGLAPPDSDAGFEAFK